MPSMQKKGKLRSSAGSSEGPHAEWEPDVTQSCRKTRLEGEWKKNKVLLVEDDV